LSFNKGQFKAMKRSLRSAREDALFIGNHSVEMTFEKSHGET